MAEYTVKTIFSEYTYSDVGDTEKYNKKLERDTLLYTSDYTVMPDRGLSDVKLAEWKTYRQALRDMNFSDPANLNWPDKPE